MVQHPQSATMGGENHRVVARVQRDLVDAHHRQIRLQPLPILAAVNRQEQSGFRADVQDVGVPLILSERFDDLTFEVSAQRRPGLAEVFGGVDVGLEIILTMAIERDVGGAFLVT